MPTLDEMLSKLGRREHSMRAVIKELPGYRPLIVETGCIRQKDNWLGDGQSTLIWQEIGEVHSVDIDHDAVELTKTLTKYPTTANCMDSIEFLWNFRFPIGVLYLDSLDFDSYDPLKSAIHHLHELAAAMKNLTTGSIVMVDDTAMGDFGVFGKGMLIFPFMQKIGAQLIVSGPHQMAWKLK